MSLIAGNCKFRLLFSATAVSNLGDGISALAFPWLATLITRDPILISAAAAARRLPWLLLSLPAGMITDQMNRQRLMVGADILQMLLIMGVVALILSAPTIPLAIDAAEAMPLIAVPCAFGYPTPRDCLIRWLTPKKCPGALPGPVQQGEYRNITPLRSGEL